MRYFSHEWASTDDQNVTNQVCLEYSESVLKFTGQTGEFIRQFVHSEDLRGALIDKLKICETDKVVTLHVVTGDVSSGYFYLEIIYVGCRILSPSADGLSKVLDSRTSRIRFDEFEHVSKGSGEQFDLYLHRILMWPKIFGEMIFEFSSMTLNRRPLDRRGYLTYGLTLETD